MVFASWSVAPHAGARIETLMTNTTNSATASLPTRERELKPGRGEITLEERRRSPRGSAN